MPADGPVELRQCLGCTSSLSPHNLKAKASHPREPRLKGVPVWLSEQQLRTRQFTNWRCSIVFVPVKIERGQHSSELVTVPEILGNTNCQRGMYKQTRSQSTTSS
ncbi:Uncharacterized protein HZ326_21795 [Fusarium oxysporum f. sp. albedinis]|nr:Uncharacterized protein HZ326_21795 [Fusarium oxysporum f. sp. albedinis]